MNPKSRRRSIMTHAKAQRAVIEAHKKLIANAVDKAEWETTAELRALMVPVMQMVCLNAGEKCAALAAGFQGQWTGSKTETVHEPNDERIEASVRAIARFIDEENHNADVFKRELMARVEREAKTAALGCLDGNA